MNIPWQHRRVIKDITLDGNLEIVSIGINPLRISYWEGIQVFVSQNNHQFSFGRSLWQATILLDQYSFYVKIK